MAATLEILLTLCIMILVHCPRGIMPIDIGVTYGTNGDDLPSAADVINLYISKNIEKIRLFDPNPDALKALKGSGIRITLVVPNERVKMLADYVYSATVWFSSYLQPYLDGNIFSYICVGNGALANERFDYSLIAQGMRNLEVVLGLRNLSAIKVTTAVSASLILGKSYALRLPSESHFADFAAQHDTMNCLRFLSNRGWPLMINVYPYYAVASDPEHIRLDYAQFTAKKPVVVDKNLSYYNMFDALIDSIYWAMEKLGFNDTGLVVSESGWPSAGKAKFATKDLAMTYNRNFVKHVLKNAGTPKRPLAKIESFIFAMFNENQRGLSAAEKNFGLFYPNMTAVYPLPW